MKSILKKRDLILVGLITIFFAILPIARFIPRYLENINVNGDSGKMALIELWDYLSFIDGNWFLILSPISILILVTFRLNRKNNENINYLKIFLQPLYLILGYSFLLFLIALILPTRGYFPYEYNVIDHPIAFLIFKNINLALFTIFITSIGLITSKYIKNLYVNILGSIALFLLLMLGLILIGSGLESVMSNTLNSDWLYIYNVFQFDAGVSIAFSFVYIFCLAMLGLLVAYLTFKSDEL